MLKDLANKMKGCKQLSIECFHKDFTHMLVCSTIVAIFIKIIIETKKWNVIKTGEKPLGKKYIQLNMSGTL